jgi:hypothetical protein
MLPLLIAGVAMGGLQVLEANNQAKSIKRQAAFQAQQAKFNQQLIDLQKKDLADIASGQIAKRQSQTKQIVGAQKVAIASQGIELDSDVALELETQEYKLSLDDEMNIKNNAWRESLGLSIEQGNIKNQSMFDQSYAKSQARSTIATGYLQGASTAMGAFGRMS